jgi:hypothetical protein
MVSGQRRLIGLVTAGAVGACCLGAVGCGSSGGGSISAAPDPLANLTAARVVAQAVADLNAAPSFTVGGAGIVSGQYVVTNVAMVRGKGCTGMIMQGSRGSQGSLAYITIGQTVYFKPDSVMWQALAGSDAAKIISTVKGRYVKEQLTDGNLHGIGNCGNIGPRAGAGAVSKGQVIMLNEVRVLPIKNSAGDVLYVTDTSKPEVVQDDTAPVEGTTDPAGEYVITAGARVTLTAPPASQVVSGASLDM